MKLNYDCSTFLKNCDSAWIQYSLNEKSEKANLKEDLKKAILSDEKIISLIEECKNWPDSPLLRHNDAKHIIHKICLLLDLGLDINDIQMKEIAKKILANQSDEGQFLTLLTIAKSFGGSGEASMQWILCDYPILLYILIKLGFKGNTKVKESIIFLKQVSSDNGWRCVGSVEKFRGPGRKTDHCPYATLVSLKVFSLMPEYHNEDFIKNGIDAILSHWKNQAVRKIYMFGIGTDFKKLKYPNIWFDIVHVLRVLSKFEYARKQDEFYKMLEVLKEKQQINGGFIPESIYLAYKGWGFGQKKEASPMLTYRIWDIFENINM
jgi:hypothetical protein